VFVHRSVVSRARTRVPGDRTAAVRSNTRRPRRRTRRLLKKRAWCAPASYSDRAWCPLRPVLPSPKRR
jgi:hypothetical protein